MAGQSRTLKQWNALSKSQQNRWRQAYGADAITLYRQGAKLPLRGHAYTPERPAQALSKPWLYPKYIATHQSELNEIARQKGLAQHGKGPRGETPKTRDYKKAGGDYTYVAPAGSFGPPDWHFSQVFRTMPEAQLYARRSWAPAGVVQIQDNQWLSGTRPPDTTTTWRYEVWFGYPEPRKKAKKYR